MIHDPMRESRQEQLERAQLEYLKNIQHEKQRVEEQKFALDIARLSILGFFLVITVLFALVIFSPGVFLALYLKNIFFEEITFWIAWGIAITASSFLFGLIYLKFQNIKKSVVVYAVFASIFTAASLVLPSKLTDAQPLAWSAIVVFMKIGKLNPSTVDTAAAPTFEGTTQVAPAIVRVDPSDVTAVNEESRANVGAGAIDSSSSSLTLEGLMSSQAEVVTPSRVEPSFKCSSNLNAVENIVCSDSELALLDLKMSSSFSEARKVANPEIRKLILQVQRDWIKSLQKCTDKDCIKKLYEYRIEQLSARPSL